MPIESKYDFIDDFNPAWPNDNPDLLAQQATHSRGIKNALQGSFPNLGQAAVTKTAAQLNGAVSSVKSVDDNFIADGNAQGDAPITTEIVNVTSTANTSSLTLPSTQWSNTIVTNTSGGQILLYAAIGDTFHDTTGPSIFMQDGDTVTIIKYTSSKVMRIA